MDIDLYAFFGVSDDCSAKDVKRAYKEKARQLHPDKNKDNPKASKLFSFLISNCPSEEEFQQLKDYYDILHEPVTRFFYGLRCLFLSLQTVMGMKLCSSGSLRPSRVLFKM
ncbi:uncharacterized protein DEA37_0014350 [Paragonimus westermani]|uniref:J domain-containing protein n=1 Tax=Paragonimus westermani TaxID=34504 RepID=A0A5J4N492_9TREM|nr:uncharacterized protein DEA37_0010809 [Paragonimus westermani]KAA3670277.1 uncharacterized protein DEA37_0014350 [Paragonimus westermani]